MGRAGNLALGLAVLLGTAWTGCSKSTGSPEAKATTARGVALMDLEGREYHPFEDSQARAIVFLFVRTDCPVSNRYAPEVRSMFHDYREQGVDFWLVYPDPDATVEAIDKHLEEYRHPLPALRDPRHTLVDLTGVTITPEVAVFVPGSELVYRGRIDDRYVDFGKTRARATRHDLRQALDAVLSGEPIAHPRTQAVGCFIADLR
jgi:hypothetical protein